MSFAPQTTRTQQFADVQFFRTAPAMHRYECVCCRHRVVCTDCGWINFLAHFSMVAVDGYYLIISICTVSWRSIVFSVVVLLRLAMYGTLFQNPFTRSHPPNERSSEQPKSMYLSHLLLHVNCYQSTFTYYYTPWIGNPERRAWHGAQPFRRHAVQMLCLCVCNGDYKLKRFTDYTSIDNLCYDSWPFCHISISRWAIRFAVHTDRSCDFRLSGRGTRGPGLVCAVCLRLFFFGQHTGR